MTLSSIHADVTVECVFYLWYQVNHDRLSAFFSAAADVTHLIVYGSP